MNGGAPPFFSPPATALGPVSAPLLDALPFGVAVTDQNRHILFANQALEGLSGYARENMIGIPCGDVIRGGACADGCPLLKGGGESASWSGETDIITGNRRRIPVRLTCRALAEPGAPPSVHVTVVEDARRWREQDISRFPGASVSRILGAHPTIQEIRRTLPAIAQTAVPVLITGEGGTGKGFMAEAIHAASLRSRGPFVRLECAGLPEAVLASELFGTGDGGADRGGRLRLAQGGTLYIAEVTELPPALQDRLPALMGPGSGALGELPGDVRILAGASAQIEELSRQGRFRAELLSRLGAVRLHLPPLRDRGGDVDFFLRHFLQIFASRPEKTIHGFSRRAIETLVRYPYPGNIRELRNIVEHAVLMCAEEEIGLRHLPAYVNEWRRASEVFSQAARPEAEAASDWPAAERQMILDALVRAGGRRGAAAAALGWGRSTLWRKMRRHGIAG